jgi:hypothetical protein
MRESNRQPPEKVRGNFYMIQQCKLRSAAKKDEISTAIAWQQSIVLSGASTIGRMPRLLPSQPTIRGVAYSQSGATEPAAVAFGASAASVAHVSAAVAVSVAGAAAPSVVVLPGWPVVSPFADVPAPASAGAFAGPFAAFPAASPAPVGTSDPVLRFPCLRAPRGLHVADHSDGSPVARHYFQVAEYCSPSAEYCFRAVEPLYTTRQLLWSSPHRCL